VVSDLRWIRPRGLVGHGRRDALVTAILSEATSPYLYVHVRGSRTGVVARREDACSDRASR